MRYHIISAEGGSLQTKSLTGALAIMRAMIEANREFAVKIEPAKVKGA